MIICNSLNLSNQNNDEDGSNQNPINKEYIQNVSYINNELNKNIHDINYVENITNNNKTQINNTKIEPTKYTDVNNNSKEAIDNNMQPPVADTINDDFNDMSNGPFDIGMINDMLI